MPTAIENAREALYNALKKLPVAGLRTDYIVKLAWILPDEANPNTMDPSALDYELVPDATLEIIAADVKPYSGFAMLAIAMESGGTVQQGDHRVKLVRTAELEDFLRLPLVDLSETKGGPYPEMDRLVITINGLHHKPVRWVPGTMYLELIVRRIS